MFRHFTILLLVLFSAEVFGQFLNDNFTISYPDYIPVNKDFEVSIITSKVYSDADTLKLYFSIDNNIEFIKADLRTRNQNKKTDFSLSGRSEWKICKIDLKDSSLFPDNFFQVLLKFYAGPVSKSKFIFSGEFLKDNLVIGHLESNDVKLHERSAYTYETEFSFYESTKLANQLCRFIPESKLEIPLNFHYSNQLAINFWLRAEKNNINIINIKDKITDQLQYSLSMNRNQVLSAQSEIYSQIILNPQFISLDDWYSVTIIFDKAKHYIDFLLNGIEVTKMDFPEFINTDNLNLEFTNDSRSAAFSIDQFRVFDAAEDYSDIIRNCTFKDFISDGSKLLQQINFNDIDIYSLQNNSVILFSNLKINPSNAPIFQRAPFLNISATSNYYELEWGGGDYQNADSYSIERSTNESPFKEIHQQEADDQNNKYSFVTEKINDAEVIYFRVKQINKDGTVIYSPLVKVGQGLVDDVILEQNFPNPFNPITQIEFELLQDSDVRVVVYNVEGSEVAVLHKGFLSKGIYRYQFDGSELPSGIYLCKVATPQFTQTRKMILAK